MRASPKEQESRPGLGVTVERARPEDAEAIMRLKRDAWLNAYVSEEHGVSADDINKKFTDEILRQGIANWQTGIANESDHSERMTYVAQTDGKVVGYTSPCIEGGQRRIGALYVSPAYQGLGIGGKLLSRALDWHGNDADVYLRVVSYNDKAIAFYKTYGFIATGIEFPEEYDTANDMKLLPEIEMVHKA